jgi:hypothetical protein
MDRFQHGWVSHYGSHITCYSDSINVVRCDTFALDNLIKLWPRPMDDHRIKSNAVQEAETQSQLVKLVQDSASDFDNSKLGGLRRM